MHAIQPGREADRASVGRRRWFEWVLYPAAVWGVLLVSLFTTVLGWRWASSNVRARAQERFGYEEREALRLISQRMLEYEQVLRGTLGLFAASEKVEREEWATYFTNLQVNTYYPGIQALGYVERIDAAALPVLEERMRREGDPDFIVKSTAPNREKYPILYVQPRDERNRHSVGYDLAAVPAQRAAMDRSRDTEQAALSGKYIVLDPIESETQAGVTLYLPVYRRGASHDTLERRRIELLGFVYAAFRMHDLMRGLLDHTRREVGVAVYDGDGISAESFLHASGIDPNQDLVSSPPTFSSTNRIHVAGHVWTICCRTQPLFDDNTSSSQPMLIAAGGTAIDLMLFAIFCTLAQRHQRALRLASSMTQEMRASDERFRTLADFSPIGIFLTDGDGRCLYTNRRWQEISGLTLEQSLGEGWAQAIHPEDRDQVFHGWELTAKSHQRYSSHMRFVRSDGTVRWVEAHAAPVHGHGRITGYVGTAEDITDRKQAEEDLRLQKRELERSNEALEQYAYVASHDLQEPLRAVGGSVQLLLNRHLSRLDHRGVELLEQAALGVRRMHNLIQDLLTLSRVNARPEKIAPTDTGKVLDESCETLRLAIAESQATIERSALPTILADSAQLSQVFQNLLANALKFRSQKPPAIRVQAEPQSDGWLFSVADNGIGIEKTNFDRIFKIFQRLHSRRSYEGTGIGLAICKKVIERHGGRIWVESEPGRGATFRFHIPARVPGSGHSQEHIPSA